MKEKTLKELKEKGITLVALVVTIIILLILAGVTINLALGEGGIFAKAKNTADRYQAAQSNELEQLTEIEQTLNKYENGGKANIPEDMKVGDKVNYTPDQETTSYELTSEQSGYDTEPSQTITQQSFEWKVLSINKDSVDLMGIPTEDMQLVYFKGATAYNNGVYYFNDICKTLYSNKKLRIEARSINLEDIESRMNDTGKVEIERYANSSSNTKYNDTKDYSGDFAWYPNLAKYENILGIDDSGVSTGGISRSNDGTGLKDKGITIPLLENDTSTYSNSRTQANKITVKQTYYQFKAPVSYFDSDFYNLVFGTGTNYRLASRYSTCSADSAAFGFFYVTDGIYGDYFFRFSDDHRELGSRLCPVVSLKSNIQYESTGDGVWNIK